MRDNRTVTMKEKLEEARRALKEKLASGTPVIPPVIYKCATCQDMGLVRSAEVWGHPLFGKLVACPDCEQHHNTDRHEDTSGLLPEEYTLDWGQVLDLGEQGNNIKGAVRAVKSTLVAGYGWVYLHGAYGVGKTLLLKVATARAMKNGRHAIYIKAEYMLDNLRAALKNDTFDKLFDTYVKVPVLALEEFEKINPTDWAEVRLFHLLDDRWSRATARNPQGVTLFAANVGVDGIPYPALRSRIRDERFVVYEVTGQDVRQVSKQLNEYRVEKWYQK